MLARPNSARAAEDCRLFVGLLFLVLFFFFRQARQRHDPLAFFELDQPHALSVAADDADIFDAQANDFALCW